MIALYFGGILVGLITALISKNTIFKGEAVPFVMELPNYRMPSMKSVDRLLWEKAKDFVTRAFTVIFAATLIIWFLQTFDLQIDQPENGLVRYELLEDTYELNVIGDTTQDTQTEGDTNNG